MKYYINRLVLVAHLVGISVQANGTGDCTALNKNLIRQHIDQKYQEFCDEALSRMDLLRDNCTFTADNKSVENTNLLSDVIIDSANVKSNQTFDFYVSKKFVINRYRCAFGFKVIFEHFLPALLSTGFAWNCRRFGWDLGRCIVRPTRHAIALNKIACTVTTIVAIAKLSLAAHGIWKMFKDLSRMKNTDTSDESDKALKLMLFPGCTAIGPLQEIKGKNYYKLTYNRKLNSEVQHLIFI